MTDTRRVAVAAGLLLCLIAPQAHAEQTLFAVVSKPPKDKNRVAAQVADATGAPEVATLIPGETIVDNPVWRKLEICSALKIEASKTADGYRVVSVRVLDAGMLPMALQSFAGDCLIKKAIEPAPTGD